MIRHKVWTRLGRHAGGLQWRILWLAHTSYIAGVSGLIRNDAGQVLLFKHAYWLPSRPYGLPTGYAKAGERFEDTVVREVREETGLAVKVGELARLKTGFKLRIEVAYLGEFIGGEAKLDPHEVLAAKFYDIDNLPDGLLPSHRDLIEAHRYWFKGDDVDRADAQREADRRNGTEAGDL
jgi:8-oxo-dGTP diphosphatase